MIWVSRAQKEIQPTLIHPGKRTRALQVLLTQPHHGLVPVTIPYRIHIHLESVSNIRFGECKKPCKYAMCFIHLKHGQAKGNQEAETTEDNGFACYSRFLVCCTPVLVMISLSEAEDMVRWLIPTHSVTVPQGFTTKSSQRTILCSQISDTPLPLMSWNHTVKHDRGQPLV